MNLFVYGELCKVAVLRAQIGRVPAAGVALLSGHARRKAESGWFEITPQPGARVPGLVLRDLRIGEVERLDRFEGVAEGCYRRAKVTVRTLGDDPAELEAHAYLAGRSPEF